ncbi:MAG: hypothetical protein K8T20_15865 [Planctomycetes bacterium]|nr:hypothetical protein [Planctomycetota bacterium]
MGKRARWGGVVAVLLLMAGCGKRPLPVLPPTTPAVVAPPVEKRVLVVSDIAAGYRDSNGYALSSRLTSGLRMLGVESVEDPAAAHDAALTLKMVETPGAMYDNGQQGINCELQASLVIPGRAAPLDFGFKGGSLSMEYINKRESVALRGRQHMADEKRSDALPALVAAALGIRIGSEALAKAAVFPETRDYAMAGMKAMGWKAATPVEERCLAIATGDLAVLKRDPGAAAGIIAEVLDRSFPPPEEFIRLVRLLGELPDAKSAGWLADRLHKNLKVGWGTAAQLIPVVESLGKVGGEESLADLDAGAGGKVEDKTSALADPSLQKPAEAAAAAIRKRLGK